MEPGSIHEAAFSGFRVVRERPRAIAVWVIVLLALTLIFSVFMVSSAGPALTRVMALSGRIKPDPTEILALWGQIAPTYLGLMAMSALFYAVFFAAMNRAVLTPDDDRFAYLRLGIDELRQLGLVLALGLVSLILYIGFVIVAIVIGVILSLILGAAGGASAVGVSIGVAVILVLFLGMGFFWIRLSLASPLTYATGRINLFGSWTLTRGRFWPIAGTYLLVLALLLAVYLVGFLLIVAVVAAAGGGVSPLSMMIRPDMSSLGAYFSPIRLIFIVLNAALSALALPVMLCPAAEIYRRLADKPDTVIARGGA